MLSTACKRKLLTTSDCLNIINKLKADIKNKQEFLRSEKCIQMCKDVKRLNIKLTNEEFAQNPEQLKSKLNWCTLSDEVVEQFFAAMCYFEDIDFDIDEECMFDNYVYKRNGLKVTLIYGQGALVTMCAEN